ncbi:hypothetical protein DMH18_17985 [Streptomyces sp. WAC 06783]|uniref:hypothetical protein n=1 Tax=Streptomyces sp. WAC 06783 TaxID=2203211 RepID=UPI000F745EAB|nr:hypothetical protein [Streptomyces sp. WAC 06783]RSO09316.1 hypothetical protein DMH18_17985 [Streptomyces sp. WAC 06783]
MVDYLTAGGSNSGQFQGLQIANGARSATWSNKKYENAEAWEFADAIPSWGPVLADTAGRVTNEYLNFFTSIDIPPADPVARRHADALAIQLVNKNAQIAGLRSQLPSDWNRFNNSQQSLPSQHRMSYQTWLAQVGGVKLAVAEADYRTLASDWGYWSNLAGGGNQAISVAQQEYNNPGYQLQVTYSSGVQLPKRVWHLTPRLADFVGQTKKGQGTRLSITMNSSTRKNDTTQSSWGSGGFLLFFICLGAGGNGKRIDVDTSSADFSMTFDAPAFTGIRITPGPWFNRSVLTQYRNGPFISTSPYGNGKASFFDSQGSFSLMKETVYVAYQPTIRARIDKSAHQQMQESWNRGSGLSIGPFSFGGQSSTGSTNRDTFESSKDEITLVSKSPDPQIIAVQNSIMP